MQLLFTEVLNPFYLFQAYSVVLWYATDYYYYASCIFLISLVTVVNELIATRKNIRNLKKMSEYQCELTVKRINASGEIYTKVIESNELVPGDKFLVPENIKMPCDAILTAGSCIANESMLTGESIPVFKAELPKIPNN
jgi:cation-transporting ATPase 13A2